MRDERYAGLSDQEIIELIRNKDNEAIDYLLEKYKNLVRKKANTLFLIGGDKDDLIQEGMIGLYKAIRDYDDSCNNNFFAFADLCISRQMYTAIKLSNRKKHIPLNDYVSFYAPAFGEESSENTALLDVFLSNNQNPEELVIDKESTSMLEYELERRLSSMEQQVLGLYLGGKNYQEIAKELEREPKSIDNALQRIKTKLTHLLKELNKEI